MPILFYSIREQPCDCFSTFSPHSVEVDGPGKASSGGSTSSHSREEGHGG